MIRVTQDILLSEVAEVGRLPPDQLLLLIGVLAALSILMAVSGFVAWLMLRTRTENGTTNRLIDVVDRQATATESLNKTMAGQSLELRTVGDAVASQSKAMAEALSTTVNTVNANTDATRMAVEENTKTRRVVEDATRQLTDLFQNRHAQSVYIITNDLDATVEELQQVRGRVETDCTDGVILAEIENAVARLEGVKRHVRSLALTAAKNENHAEVSP